ncbi:MAG: PadR family transcriptional regulator [Gemmatimonadota bacterium]
MSRPVDIQALGRAIHEVVILASLREGPKHGYQIALDVERETAGAFQFQHGTLYPILHRLEAEDRIEGEWDAGSGRRRKLYRLTDAGRTSLVGETERIGEVFGILRDYLREPSGGGA